MKKVVATVLCIVVMLSQVIPASAEAFTLRNGILFGDTMEEILEKESSLVRDSDDSNWFTGKVAGRDNTKVGFAFDDDEKLESMVYGFQDFSSKDSMNEHYQTLYQSLVRQYGKPIGNTGGRVELISGPAFERMALIVYFLGELDGCSGAYNDYDEWTLDTDGGHVKIDLISYYFRNAQYDYTYYVDLSYYFYTDEDYENAMNEKIAETSEIDNDL